MLVIRLARGGRKKYPVYRIVAADKRRAATGKFVAILGNYNPHTKELKLNQEEIVQYVQNGAQPSEAVLRLMKKDGMELPAWASIPVKNRKPKKEPEVKEAKAEEATTPAEEAPADAEVASEAADTKEAVAAETHNVDSAEASEASDSTEATEATADAVVETAQAADNAEEAAEEKSAE